MIERLYAHNYRCLENFTIDLSGRSSTLLLGRNGSGKSTVLACLRLFQSIGRGAGRVGNLIVERDFAQYRLDRPMRFAIEISHGGKRFAYEIAFEWPPRFHEARILDEKLTCDGIDVFQRSHSQIHLAGGGSFGLDWHIPALPIIEPKPGETELRTIRAFLASMIVPEPVPSLMHGYATDPTNRLDRHATNFAGCLRALLSEKPRAYSTIDDELKAVMPDFASFENREIGEKGTQLIVQFEQADPPTSLSVEFGDLSSGEKCFFLAAYIVAANRNRSPVFCAWDEPDNHLSIAEISQLIVSLRKMGNPGGQFIATSHHPETIRTFSSESTLVLTRKSHLEPSRIRPLAEIDYQGDLIHALIRDEVIGSR